MSIFTHHGPWDTHSRQSRTLRFLEKYTTQIDDTKTLPSTPSSTFYSPDAIFHDTRGDVYISGPHIWTWLQRTSSIFSRIKHEVIEIRVIPEEEGREVVYGEFLTHFWLKGDKREIEVVAPRLFVFVVGEKECEGGTEGLQIYEAIVFWDTGVLGRYLGEEEEVRKGEELPKNDKGERGREVGA